MTKRRNFSDQFKAAAALEALRGHKTGARDRSPATTPPNAGEHGETAGY